MSWFFATVMVMAHFNSLLPKADDYAHKSKAELVQAYSAACLELFSRPDLKDLDLPSLVDHMSTDNFVAGDNNERINAAQLVSLYKKVCHSDPDLTALDNYDKDLADAGQIYSDLNKDLPDVGNLKNLHLPQAIRIFSADGTLLNEIYKPGERRHWVSIQDVPNYIPKGFVAVEDHRFFIHHGVDEIGIMRALFKSFVSANRAEGGSTITQQVARNLFLDKTVTFSRKLREILLSEKIEAQLSKQQILELYLNLIYFGRNAWGIDEAARAYFGVAPKNLSLPEAAYLVGVVKGPNLYQFQSPNMRARVRTVLAKMVSEKVIEAAPEVNFDRDLHFVDFNPGHAAYFRDFVMQQYTQAQLDAAFYSGAPVQSTINEQMQTVAETELQNGLMNYERNFGRNTWRGPIGNIFAAIEKQTTKDQAQQSLQAAETEKTTESLFGATSTGAAVADPSASSDDNDPDDPSWLPPLRQFSGRHAPPVPSWQIGVVTNDGSSVASGTIRVGTPDGQVRALTQQSQAYVQPLHIGDLIYVAATKNPKLCNVQQPPLVNGAAMVMDPKTGTVLAMVGGFSYEMSQYNRTEAKRQPGSLMKPFTYMAALQQGYQPNFMLQDGPFKFPPTAPGGQPWVPHNYEGNFINPHPMRWALEQSRNVMTADLMSHIGMDPIRALAKEFGVYDEPDFNFPFILGDQETSLVRLMRAYAAIDVGYLTPTKFPAVQARIPLAGVDAITLYQIRYLLQGVLAHGTAARLHDLSEVAAGKTGTTDEARDAWFITFTPNLIIGVYVGYDQPQSLGRGAEGSTVATPIAEKILRASFNFYHPAEAFPAPPPGITFFNTDRFTGEIRAAADKNTIVEAYRTSQLQTGAPQQ